jgi:hypothetical protein
MLRNALSMKGKIMFKKITALVATLALTFAGLTAITGPTQQANAYTSPLCGPAFGTGAEPITATVVTYGGLKFDIIGYNKNGNEVGVSGSNEVNQKVWLLSVDEASHLLCQLGNFPLIGGLELQVMHFIRFRSLVTMELSIQMEFKLI